MNPWMPGAKIVRPVSRSGGTFIGVPWKVVVHTTEGGGNWAGATSYHGNQFFPHFEVQAGVGITQYLPIDRSAYALYNGAEVGETNNANAVQVEVAGYAKNAPGFPLEVLGYLADIIRFVHEQTGMAIQFPLPFRLPFTSGVRLTGAAFHALEGVIGHQHVGDGNDHTDPGLIDVATLKSLLYPITPEVPSVSPSAFRYAFGGLDYLFDGEFRVFMPLGHFTQLELLDDQGVKNWGTRSTHVHDMLSGIAKGWK